MRRIREDLGSGGRVLSGPKCAGEHHPRQGDGRRRFLQRI